MEALEHSLEKAEQDTEEAVSAAVAAARAELLAQHKGQLEKADAALEELTLLRYKIGELEQTIVRLSPKREAEAAEAAGGA